MKKLLSLILAMCMVLSTMGTVAFAEESTVSADLEIGTAEELIAFAKDVNENKNEYSGKTVVLTADIDLEGSEANLWTPIGASGDSVPKFKGTFDGLGHTIKKLYVKQGAAYHAAGLFGATNGTIKDLTIDGAYIESLSSGSATVNGTAVVAGSTAYGATIENVHVKNAVVKGNRYVAGVVGYMDGTVKNCSVEDVTIVATPDNLTGSYDNGDKVGGIVGYCNSNAVEISDCQLNGAVSITAYRDVAGIVGCVNSTVKVNNNTNSSALTITVDTTLCGERSNYNVGEFIGRNAPASATGNTATATATFENKVVLAPKTIEVATKAELDSAIKNAAEGDVILLTADIDYTGTATLVINKEITIDLGGKNLTTNGTYGGIKLKGNCSLKNGTLNHNGTATAIKAWNVKAIEDVVIDVAFKEENKIIGGIVIQEGTTNRIDTIKNVTLKGGGLTNGIETYNCGDATQDVIGSMENVTINAKGTGMLISAPCGTATNCDIKGGKSGIELWIKGTYSAKLNLVDCDVEGGTQALYIHDEFSSNPNVVNSGELKLTADEASTFVSENGKALNKEISKAENVVLSKEILKLYTLSGSGTAEDPYLIGSLEDLKWFRDSVNTYTQDGSNQYKGKYVKLTADIDLAGENWTPIGTNSSNDHMAFLGTFDGDGHTISNLYINGDGDHLGFFARVGSYQEGITPTVKNIKFNNVDVSSNTTTGHGGSYVGGVIANAGGNSVVENVHITGDVYVVGYGYIGGIVGHGYPDIIDCSVIANDGSYVNCYYWCVGGIIGYAGENGTPITNCHVEGLDIWSDRGGAAAVAGVLQDNNTLTNVSAKDVEITSNSDYVMGYIAGNGEASTLTNVTIENVKVTAKGKEITSTDAVAKVGESIFFDLQDAITAASVGDEIVIVADGTYVLPGFSKNITITGAEGIEAIITVDKTAVSEATFNNVTFKYSETSSHNGIQHATKLTYNDCTIIGQPFLYAAEETFNNCTFTTTDANNYNVWTYAAGVVSFNDCTFNCAGRSVLVYNDGAIATDVTFKGCKFIASQPATGKAAIEVDTSYMPGGTDIVINNTTATGFATGSVSGNSLWNDKKNQAKFTVTVDDVKVWPIDPADRILPTATVTEIENDDLTFALNFKADEVTDGQLGYYGDWYADFVLTVNKEVTFNANGGADGYLSGQYDGWSKNWVNVPFEDVTLKAGESLKIMEYAAERMGQTSLKLTYNDVYSMVKDFDCGVYLEDEFLKANPDFEVTLELRMFNNEDESESYVIGETYEFVAPVVKPNLFKIAGRTVSYGSSLDMNFYISKNGDGEDYVAKITKSYADGRAAVVEEIPFSEWVKDGSYWKVTFKGIAAKEMKDNVEITIYNEDGEAVSETINTSITSYAEDVLRKNNYKDKDKILAVDMVNYGAAAQKHFNYGTDNLANSTLTEDEKLFASDDVPYGDVELTHTENAWGSLLVYESKVVLRMYFKNLTDDMTAKITFTDHYGKKKEFDGEIATDKDGYKYIEVDQLATADYKTVVTCTIYNADGSEYAMAQDSIEQNMKRQPKQEEIYGALMKFGHSAFEFFH